MFNEAQKAYASILNMIEEEDNNATAKTPVKSTGLLGRQKINKEKNNAAMEPKQIIANKVRTIQKARMEIVNARDS